MRGWDGGGYVWKGAYRIKAIEENNNIYYNHITEIKY